MQKYYVDFNAKVDGDGSERNPWKDLSHLQRSEGGYNTTYFLERGSCYEFAVRVTFRERIRRIILYFKRHFRYWKNKEIYKGWIIGWIGGMIFGFLIGISIGVSM